MHTSLWFTDEIETKFQMFQILVWVRYIDIFFFRTHSPDKPYKLSLSLVTITLL